MKRIKNSVLRSAFAMILGFVLVLWPEAAVTYLVITCLLYTSKHETRDAETMIAGLRDMLDRNISFSLYMTHGGTTFGHWGGANSPAYSAMCSSYDYDRCV